LAETVEKYRLQEGKFGGIQRVTHDGAYYLGAAAYSLASFLQTDDRFCVEPADDCAVYPRNVACEVTADAALSLAKQTLFAFRTCKELHGDRLQEFDFSYFLL
jgi:hypothetical protein